MKRHIKKIIGIYETRRSIYNFTGDCPINEEMLLKFLEETLILAPSPWNYQSQRLVVFTGESHKKLWKIINKYLPIDEQKRVKSFSEAHGTILFFFDEASSKKMMKDHDLPIDRCSEYEIEANAMTQFAIWTGLSYLGCGVNIQHFRPEADKDIAKTFSIPSSWILRTQMVFGETAFVPTEHEHLDIKTRIMINR